MWAGRVATVVHDLMLPKMTLSDEICGRLYYVVSSFIDAIQTVTKVVRSILTSLLALVGGGSSFVLNKATYFSWHDASFSLQMTLYSILGILDPQWACRKKFQLHWKNMTSLKGQSLLLAFLEEQKRASKSIDLQLYLKVQVLESGVRYLCSCIRFGWAKVLADLSGKEAQWVAWLRQTADRSMQCALVEVRLVWQKMVS